MNIPSIPVEKLLNDELHDIDPAWRQFFDQLVNALQVNAGLEGLVAPSQTDNNVLVIQNNQLQNFQEKMKMMQSTQTPTPGY